MNLKNFLKSLKLNEATISMVLGALVILVVGVLVINYIRDRKGEILPGLSTQGESETKTHIVLKGETLWDLAEKYYGSGWNWLEIAKENNLVNPNKIEEGQSLEIPDGQLVSKTTSAITESQYTIQKGDSLWKIAVRAYGDGYKWVEIAGVNPLKNPNLIYPGNILTIPR